MECPISARGSVFALIALAACCTLASGAVRTGTSEFWRRLEAGETQSLLIMGSSMSSSDWAPWSNELGDMLRMRFGTRITFSNKARAGMRCTEVKNSIGALVAGNPDLVIVECAFDDEDCGTGGVSCGRAIWEGIIDGIRRQSPGCEIVWYIPNPWCTWGGSRASRNSRLLPFYEEQRKLCAEQSLYLFDTWQSMMDIAMRDQSFVRDGTCGSYGAYCPDGHHTSLYAAHKVILPLLFNALRGAPDPTGPSVAPRDVLASVVAARSARIVWQPVAQSSDPESGIAGYNVFRKTYSTNHPDYPDGIVKVGMVDPSKTSFVDTTFRPTANENQPMKYYVTSFNPWARQSPMSTGVTVGTGDAYPPGIVSATPSAQSIRVLFDEPLDRATAQTVSNFVVDGGVSIKVALLQSDLTTVVLATSPLADCRRYRLTAKGISDTSANRNSAVDSVRFFFTISALPLCFTSPQAGATYSQRQPIRISWDTDSTRFKSLVLRVSLDGGKTFGDIHDAAVSSGAGVFYWTVPAYIAVSGGMVSTISNQVLIEGEDYGTPGRTSRSGLFGIVAGNPSSVSADRWKTRCSRCGLGSSSSVRAYTLRGSVLRRVSVNYGAAVGREDRAACGTGLEVVEHRDHSGKTGVGITVR